MSTVTVYIKELDKLINNMTRLKSVITPSRGISSSFKAALDDVGKKILTIVKEETPVGDDTQPGFHDSSQFHTDRKHLKDAWEWKTEVKGNKISGFAVIKSPKLNNLVNLLEAGSPRHNIKARSGSTLRFYTRQGSSWELAYTQSVNHPGFKANKFTDRAQKKSNVLIKELSSVLQREVNRILSGK